MNALQITHALNRIVPAMASGFTVQTTYGELAIEPGPLAEAMRDLVAQHAQMELTRIEQTLGVRRRVQPDMTINYGGERWCLLHLPDAHPGAWVTVTPGAHGGAPLIEVDQPA